MTNQIGTTLVQPNSATANITYQQFPIMPQAQSVVSSDTSADATVEKGTQATTLAIENLVTERELWEQTAYRTSNEQLYLILQKCYALYTAMNCGTTEAKALREGLKSYIDTKSLTKHFNKSTHTITKIVKCVFGAERRRVSAYSIVLRTALALGKSVAEVPDFIRDNGGVEQIRLAKSKTAMPVKQKAAIASQTVAINNLGVVNSPALSKLMDAGMIDTNSVFIGSWQADGSVVLRAVVQSDTVLNAALASHYSSISSAAKSQATALKVETTSDAVQQAITAAVMNATVAA